MPFSAAAHAARCTWFAKAGVISAVIFVSPLVHADALLEPAAFVSSGGVLDVLIVAKPKLVPTISFSPPSGGAPINPIGWVYEVCPRPASGNDCPQDTSTVSDYGGARLKLQPGDLLKIRLVNRLPKLESSKVKHASEPGLANLVLNPTNLHTHGLIVPPRAPTPDDPTLGDYVFVEIYNSENGMPQSDIHQHHSLYTDFADYKIEIPRDHPSGSFWFHPHIHGLSLNQVSAGLAGIITIGEVQDYVASAPAVIRNLILKDLQVLAAGTLQYDSGAVAVTDGEVQNQQIADFCEQRDTGGPNSRLGFCEGQPDEHGTGNSFIGSRWYFTVNGQVFPTIRIISPDGEIWRLTNASGQLSYLLNLVDDTSHFSIAMQLISVDGVSITVPAGTPAGTLITMAGNKFTVVDCPRGNTAVRPVCVRDLIMMPSARAEVWVTYRNRDGSVAVPPPGAGATLQQGIINLGPAAEAWPQFKLAKVEFAHPRADKPGLDIAGGAEAVLSAHGGLAPAIAQATPHPAVACPPLAADHRRRIFFGVVDPTDPKTAFGLGYEEIVHRDGVPPEDQVVVAASFIPVTAYDPARAPLCVPLGPGGAAVHEIWELVNLATETHNFHIHQTKFRVLDAAPGLSPGVNGSAAIVEDNIPVPFGLAQIPEIEDNQKGYCTVEQWRARKCISHPVVLDIPFSQVGEFLYHCHILEHEDGGMMARIRVVPGVQ